MPNPPVTSTNKSPSTYSLLYCAVSSDEVCSKFKLGGKITFSFKNQVGSFFFDFFKLTNCSANSLEETLLNGDFFNAISAAEACKFSNKNSRTSSVNKLKFKCNRVKFLW